MVMHRIVLWLMLLAAPALAQERDLIMKPVGNISLGEVQGRLDQMAIDEAGQRLFVPVIEDGLLLVLDLKAEKLVTQLSGFDKPRGVAVIPSLKRIAMTTWGDGKVHFFDDQLKPLGVVEGLAEADNILYHAPSNQLYVCVAGGLALIDPEKMTKTGEIALEAHPEGLAFEQLGTRLFVNVTRARHIAVIDRRAGKVIDTWPITSAEFNYPLALDETRARLFVGSRRPRLVSIYDTGTGKLLEEHECCGDVDNIFTDPPRRRVYVTGGGGCVNTLEFSDDRYSVLETITTGLNARTSLFVPSQNRLYVAIPYRVRWQKPVIRIFEPQP